MKSKQGIQNEIQCSYDQYKFTIWSNRIFKTVDLEKASAEVQGQVIEY